MAGYRVEQFVEKPQQDLICPICHDVFRNSANCRYGHTFCNECILRWLRKNERMCPIGKEIICDDSIVPNHAIRGIINNLEVYCQDRYDDDDKQTAPKSVEKCDWTGKLKLLAKHQETCPFQQVRCPNAANCNTTMQRRKLEDHDKICKYKEVKCQKCEAALFRHELQIHKDLDCPEELVPCPNDCTFSKGLIQNLKRYELQNHLARECGNTRLQCPFKDQGCNARIFRKDFDKHLKEDVSDHMLLVSNQNKKITEENLALSNRCAELSARLKKAWEDLCTFVWTINDYPTLYKKHSGSNFRSPNFWLCGHHWFLQLYPNGNQDEEGYFSLYLCLNEATSSTPLPFLKGPVIPSVKTIVCCRFSVISHNPHTEDVTWVGNLTFSKEATTLGRPKLMKANNALSTDFCTNSDGILIVKCTIQLA